MAGGEIHGSLFLGAWPCKDGPWPLVLDVLVGALRLGFLPKCAVGHGYRAIARNGRVLLATDRSLEEMTGRVARARVQTWHRRILAGDPLEPYGILLCLRSEESSDEPALEARVGSVSEDLLDFALDLGGQRVLAFCRRGNGV
jgi:hypothetical protein